MEKDYLESGLTNGVNGSIIEDRGNPYHDDKGRFTFSTRRTSKRMTRREKTIVSHGIATDHPELKPEDGRVSYEYGDYYYVFETIETGTYAFGFRYKICKRNKNIINELRKRYKYAQRG